MTTHSSTGTTFDPLLDDAPPLAPSALAAAGTKLRYVYGSCMGTCKGNWSGAVGPTCPKCGGAFTIAGEHPAPGIAYTFVSPWKERREAVSGAAGDEHAAASLANRDQIRADYDEMGTTVRRLAIEVSEAELQVERTECQAANARGQLLTYEGDQWVDAELKACATAWLEVDDMKALERLKERHATLTQARTVRSSPAADAAAAVAKDDLAGKRKALTDAEDALKAHEKDHGLLLGLVGKVEADPPKDAPKTESPTKATLAKSDAPAIKRALAAAKLDALQPTLEPALAKAEEGAPATTLPPKDEITAMAKLAALGVGVPQRAPMPVYSEDLVADLAAAGVTWAGTAEKARLATEEAVRDALTGLKKAKKPKLKEEARDRFIGLGFAIASNGTSAA